jgi:hypothetical protein
MEREKAPPTSLSVTLRRPITPYCLAFRTIRQRGLLQILAALRPKYSPPGAGHGIRGGGAPLMSCFTPAASELWGSYGDGAGDRPSPVWRSAGECSFCFREKAASLLKSGHDPTKRCSTSR